MTRTFVTSPPSDESESSTRPQRKHWTTPRVIVSEIEETGKLIDLIEITLLPTGPS